METSLHIGRGLLGIAAFIGIGALAPDKRSELAKPGWRALLGGSIACFLTACVAAMVS